MHTYRIFIKEGRHWTGFDEVRARSKYDAIRKAIVRSPSLRNQTRIKAELWDTKPKSNSRGEYKISNDASEGAGMKYEVITHFKSGPEARIVRTKKAAYRLAYAMAKKGTRSTIDTFEIGQRDRRIAIIDPEDLAPKFKFKRRRAHASENPLSGLQEYMIGLGVLAAGALGIYLVHRNAAPATTATSPTAAPPLTTTGTSTNVTTLVPNVNPLAAPLLGAASTTIALPTGATWGQGPTTGYAGGAQGTTAPITLAAGTYPLYWVAPDGSGQITNVIVS